MQIQWSHTSLSGPWKQGNCKLPIVQSLFIKNNYINKNIFLVLPLWRTKSCRQETTNFLACADISTETKKILLFFGGQSQGRLPTCPRVKLSTQGTAHEFFSRHSPGILRCFFNLKDQIYAPYIFYYSCLR